MTVYERIRQSVIEQTFGGGFFSQRELATRFGYRKSWYFRNELFRLVQDGFLVFEVSSFLNRPGYVFAAAPAYPQMTPLFRMEEA